MFLLSCIRPNILCSESCNNVTCLFICISFQTVFDDLEGEEMRRARTRSNPYETIRGAFFLNRWVASPHACNNRSISFLNFLLCFLLRAAMKMANMDHVFDYMFTNPKDSQDVRPQLHKLEICAVITFLNWMSVCAEAPDA